ncbi:MAG: hypothetical protein PHU71_02440 [Candidatus Gracilibacteria bacterium]|nr:hypothetical protein [Candidatus Gracilibacteria bacterium]
MLPLDISNTDPSYWEKILKDSGCLSTAEEEQGLGESLSEDPVDQEIADKLAQQSEYIQCNGSPLDKRNIEYLGSPSSLESLINEIRHSLKTLRSSSREVKIGVHQSCINGLDSISVFQEGGSQHSFNTHATMDYTRERLRKSISQAFRLELIEK